MFCLTAKLSEAALLYTGLTYRRYVFIKVKNCTDHSSEPNKLAIRLCTPIQNNFHLVITKFLWMNNNPSMLGRCETDFMARFVILSKRVFCSFPVMNEARKYHFTSHHRPSGYPILRIIRASAVQSDDY